MDNFSRMDEFLKYLASVIEISGELLSSKQIYSFLNKYDVNNIDDFDFDADPPRTDGKQDENALFYKWRQSLMGDSRVLGFNDGYWFQFRNKKAKYEETDDYIKMYIPLDAEHFEKGVGEIIDFLADENIFHVSKAAQHIRFDDVVVRVTNARDAEKIAEFINNNSYIQEGLIKANPFAIQKDGIAYAYDGSMSYNSVVASLIWLYIKEEREKTVEAGKERVFDLSLDGFRGFVTNFYNEMVLNPENRNQLTEYFYDGPKFNQNDCMHIIELVQRSMDPKFTFDDFLDFCRENKFNKNREYDLLSLPTVLDMNNFYSMDTFTVHLPTNKEKENLALEIAALEGERAAMIASLEEMDRLIASKKGQLRAFEDVETFDFDGNVKISYLNVPILMMNLKLIKDNVYANDTTFTVGDSIDIPTTVQKFDDVSQLSDEVAEDLLHRCSRYKDLTNWKQIIERDMEEKNLESMQELLEVIQREKPEEYKLAKRDYEDDLIQRRIRQLNLAVYPEDFQPDFDDRHKIDIRCRIPRFEYGVEHTICPGDIELKIEVGCDYDESVDGPLYPGKINIDTGEMVPVEGVMGVNEVYPNANISFQANIPNYVSGKRYCVYDEETGVILRFEYNLVKVKELERNHSIDPPRREERVAMMMVELTPWSKEPPKKGKEPELFPNIIYDVREQEEEKIAREKLKHCKMFAGYTEKDAVIDAVIADPNNSVRNARDMVNVIKTKEPKLYNEMEDAYNASKSVVSTSVVSMHR